MNKSLIVHAGWAAVAISAFALGKRNDSEVATGQAPADDRSTSDAAGTPGGLPSATGGSVAANSGRTAGTAGSDPSGSGSRTSLSEAEVSATATVAFTDPNPLKRSLAFAKLLEGLTAENAELMLQSLKDGKANRDQWRLFTYAWGTKDPDGALSYAAANLEGERADRFAGEVVTGWASKDPDAAIAWVNSQEAAGSDDPGRRDRSLMFGLIGGLADYDIGYATNYTYQLAQAGDPNASRYLDTVASEQIRLEGIDGAVVWAENLVDGDLKGSALDRVAGHYVHRDPEAAAQWAAQFATADYGARVIEEIGDEWAERDPESSVNWLATLPQGDGRNQGTYSAFREWAQRDAMEASRHLVEMPDSPARDHAASGLARTIAGRDPESAMAWAESISDSGLRQSTLTRTAREWFRRDRAAATQWLATSGLPPEAQAEVTAPRDDRRRRG